MGITERKIRQKEEVRCAILNAAWQLVISEGWQSLSIRKIADAIEYSVPVIYDHFENKDAILLEFTKRGFVLLGEKIAAASARHTSPNARLEEIANAYWDFAMDNKEYFMLMFGLGMPSCEAVNTVPEIAGYGNTIKESIQEAINNSSKPEMDLFLKFHSYMSILHGIASVKMTSNFASKDGPVNKLVLQDAVSGFILSLK